MAVKGFFRDAFEDMKASAKAQRDKQISAAKERQQQAQARIDAVKSK